jgi:hypothetical protein
VKGETSTNDSAPLAFSVEIDNSIASPTIKVAGAETVIRGERGSVLQAIATGARSAIKARECGWMVCLKKELIRFMRGLPGRFFSRLSGDSGAT